ncbi:MAG: peroxidase [Planctomycetota bacterium]
MSAPPPPNPDTRADSGQPPTAWIATIDESEADGQLAELYAQALDPGTTRVDHVLKVHSLHPDGLAAHLAVYRASMAGTKGLRKVDRELVAVVVSKANGCHY